MPALVDVVVQSRDRCDAAADALVTLQLVAMLFQVNVPIGHRTHVRVRRVHVDGVLLQRLGFVETDHADDLVAGNELGEVARVQVVIVP